MWLLYLKYGSALENFDGNYDDDDVDVNRAWKSIRKNMKASAIDSLIIVSWNSINHGLMKGAENCSIKGSRLNCNGCRIKVKQMEIR
jgi:hypothetical protein